MFSYELRRCVQQQPKSILPWKFLSSLHLLHVQRRCWEVFYKNSFFDDMQQSHLVIDLPAALDVNEFLQCYNTVISVPNRHAPFANVKSSRATSPRYDRDCYVMKRQTRRLEKVLTDATHVQPHCPLGGLSSIANARCTNRNSRNGILV